MECEARLRGLYRIIYSKTIRPRLWNAKPACAGYTGLFTQRPSEPATVMTSYFVFTSGSEGTAGLRMALHPFQKAITPRMRPMIVITPPVIPKAMYINRLSPLIRPRSGA